MNPLTQDECRAEFEKKYADSPMSFMRDGPPNHEGYYSSNTQYAWKFWQVAWNHRTPAHEEGGNVTIMGGGLDPRSETGRDASAPLSSEPSASITLPPANHQPSAHQSKQGVSSEDKILTRKDDVEWLASILAQITGSTSYVNTQANFILDGLVGYDVD